MMRNKKRLSLALCFVSMAFGHATMAQEVDFSMRGKIELEEGRLFLIATKVKGPDTLAVADVAAGQFQLRGTVEQPVFALLTVEGFQGGFEIMIEPGINYQVDLKRNGDIDIQGGALNGQFNQYKAKVAEANLQIQELSEAVETARKENRYRTAKDLRAKLDSTSRVEQNNLSAIIDANKDNVLGAYLSTHASQDIESLPALEGIYNSLTAAAKKTDPAKILALKIERLKQLRVGSTVPNFVLPDLKGKPIDLYKLPGKLKIVDFWASWCGPCRMENPNMVTLYRDFKAKGLEIVSVSLDEKRDKWEEAVAKDQMNWVNVSSLIGWKCDVARAYSITAVPSIFVLDEHNRVVKTNIRAEELRAFVTEYLK